MKLSKCINGNYKLVAFGIRRKWIRRSANTKQKQTKLIKVFNFALMCWFGHYYIILLHRNEFFGCSHRKKEKNISGKAKWCGNEHCHRISLYCAANILPFMEWIGCWAFYQLKCRTIKKNISGTRSAINTCINFVLKLHEFFSFKWILSEFRFICIWFNFGDTYLNVTWKGFFSPFSYTHVAYSIIYILKFHFGGS